MARAHVHVRRHGRIEFDVDPNDAIAFGTREQAENAARDADVIVFVVDAMDGLNAVDIDVAGILRRTHHPVLLVANKTESPNALASVHGEFSRLGFGEPFPVSAIHGEGTATCSMQSWNVCRRRRCGRTAHRTRAGAHRTTNVGKSSLLNAILGEERTIVSDVPGTTRDSIDSCCRMETARYADRHRRRAQARRQARRDRVLQPLRSLRAISRCDIVILLVDAMKGRRMRTGGSRGSRSKRKKA